MKTYLASLLRLIVVYLLTSTAFAQGEWQYRLTPYAWVPSLKADLDIGANPPAESDTSLLDVLDFAFLLTGEAHNGDWGLIGEFNYLDLSNDATYANGLFDAETSVNGTMIGVAVQKRIHSSSEGNADVFVGLRHWSLDAEIDFERLPTASRSTNFTDPILGIKGNLNINHRWFVSGLGEIGGFGAGSDLQWEIVGRVGYRFSDTWNAVIGYRHLVLDFDNDNLIIKATMTGPFLAVDYTW
ncbi:MAG: hypothetical protein JAY67_16680 [Candidatus Thiodiazotropha taylori]|nr:hypothetical protein [Candidatus Thiodiazotropha taylori]MCG7936369.1 hypothetical protein [Candidatus Thiodiazotropha taylori]MCG7972190.1 hypothetical protein [Candidatus Thiodiazotropha taylori]